MDFFARAGEGQTAAQNGVTPCLHTRTFYGSIPYVTGRSARGSCSGLAFHVGGWRGRGWVVGFVAELETSLLRNIEMELAGEGDRQAGKQAGKLAAGSAQLHRK